MSPAPLAATAPLSATEDPVDDSSFAARWMFVVALLPALAVSTRASAKPPDLPVNPNDTTPILTPPPFDVTPPGAEAAPPKPEPLPGWPTITIYSPRQFGCGDFIAEGPGDPTTLTFYPGPHGTVVSIDPSPMPAPQTMTIYHPVRPRVPLSVLYTFDECLLFSANPLLTLVPLPESLREERHTTEQIPIPMMPQVQPDVSVQIEFDPAVPSYVRVMPVNSHWFGICQNDDQPPVCSCPCDRFVPAIADIELSNRVLENLEKMIEAEALYQEACQFVKNAQYAEAMDCLKKACALCPASRYQEMTAELVSSMVWRVFSGHREDADTEEEDVPLIECEPYWYDDAPACSPQSKQSQECPPACDMPCEKVPGVEVQVTGLMKACHLALSCGRHAKAVQLAREAHALDAERVAADPIVYKMHLLALKMDTGKCCCDDDCCCDPCDNPNCCCHAKESNKQLPPLPSCPVVELMPPTLPPVDPAIAVQLQKLFDEANVEVSKAKPNLEVVEEESEAPEAPKAFAKPFRVQAAQTETIITYDDLLRFLPGETWTEIDLKTNRVRVLWRMHVGDKVYRVRYDGGLSVDLNVMPPMGSAEKCEDPR